MTRAPLDPRVLIPLLLAFGLIGMLALVRDARAATPAESLAMLDAALMQPMSDVEIAVIVAGGATSPRVRARIAAAATDALEALNAVGSSPCYADWWMIARTAWWLLLRSTEALDAMDVASELLDNTARDAARAEFAHTIAGVDLLAYSRDLRELTTCTVVFTAVPVAKPTPAKTVTPERTDAPSPSAKPMPAKTVTPIATRAP